MKPSEFRPADTSAAAISAALAKAQEAQQELKKTAADSKARRDSLLLDGDAKQLAAAEQALRDTRDTAERIDAIVAELTSRQAAAQRREAEQRVKDACTAFTAADAALAKWWREAGPKIRDLLAEGHAHSRAKDDANSDLQQFSNTLQQRYPDAELTTPASDSLSNAWDRDRVIPRWVEGAMTGSDIQ